MNWSRSERTATSHAKTAAISSVAVDANYKLSAARIDGTLMEIDPDCSRILEIEFDMPIVYRQYLCPNCGVLLENELVRGDELPVWDVRLV